MNVLYVVNAYDNKYVDFHAVQITEENDNEFIILDKMNIENYVHNFPKDKINVELDMGYVTDSLDKRKLKIQIDRIYNKLKKKYSENEEKDLYEINERYYKSSIELLEVCVTPEEYEKQGLREKEEKELMKKIGVFF